MEAQHNFVKLRENKEETTGRAYCSPLRHMLKYISVSGRVSHRLAKIIPTNAT